MAGTRARSHVPTHTQPGLGFGAGRTCTQCSELKSPAEFVWKLRGRRLGTRCGSCRKANYKGNPHIARERSRAYYHANKEKCLKQSRVKRESNIVVLLIAAARSRAKKCGLDFDLSRADVIVPAVCPVLGLPLIMGVGRCGPGSPTLDRIDSAKGYVKGNVMVISFRANTIKSDATPAELAMVAAFYGGLAEVGGGER
jgi:hypothetical protein